MEGREKIQQLLKEGKVNSDQAVMLLNALKESDQRREKIFKQVVTQKKKRQESVQGFLGVWVVVFLCLLTVLLFVGNVQQLGKDARKGMVFFHQANDLIAQENYADAIVLIEKGITKARKFPLGYTLLAATYRLQYEKTQDAALLKEAAAAFQKAQELEGVFKRRHEMNSTAVLFLGMFVLLIAGALSVIFLIIYNFLVSSEESVNEAWARVRVYYAKKLDLIPALLEAIKEYSQHEKDVLVNVTRARSGALETLDDIDSGGLTGEKAQTDLNYALGKVFALAEQYPQIKANQHYLTIQQQLEDIEGEIVASKNRYNRKVKGYNALIKIIPLNLVAEMHKFQSREYIDFKTS